MEKVDITIIGAGVIGLAIASKLSNLYKDIIVVEKESNFGQHTSSRNSEVIHAGIYYPHGSLKAKLCVEGNRLLYGICKKHNINHKRIGKIIVAADDEEVKAVNGLFDKGMKNGVPDLKIIDQNEINKIEPNVSGICALYSESTGIIDSHSLMQYFAATAQDRGVLISYDSEVIGIDRQNGSYVIHLKKDNYKFESKILINCAGLFSDKVSSMAGINKYKLYYAKGNYFYYTGKSLINRLVYPAPEKSIKGLGIHATLDLGGRMKFGPDVQYIEKIDYTVDLIRKLDFYEAARRYLPSLKIESISPDMAGIRPKLQGPNDTEVKDFVITHEVDNGFPNFVNLIGIESPGLTAAPAIAEYVFDVVEGLL